MLVATSRSRLNYDDIVFMPYANLDWDGNFHLLKVLGLQTSYPVYFFGIFVSRNWCFSFRWLCLGVNWLNGISILLRRRWCTGLKETCMFMKETMKVSFHFLLWNKYCNWIFAFFPLNLISKFCSLINFLFFCAKHILHYCTHRFTCKALAHSHWLAPVHQQRRAQRSSVFMFILIIFHLSICVWVSWSYVFSKPGS